jgi:hypothetical protein
LAQEVSMSVKRIVYMITRVNATGRTEGAIAYDVVAFNKELAPGGLMLKRDFDIYGHQSCTYSITLKA